MRLTVSAVAVLTAVLCACSPSKAPPIAGAHALTRLGERVYVASGRDEAPSAANQGFVNNPAFVLGRKGVIVIDPGASVQAGEWLLARVREVTPLPVVAVFNTCAEPEHWLGNHAIRNAYPAAVIYSRARVIDRLRPDGGAAALAHVNKATGGAARGTKPVLPDLAVEPGESLRLSGLTFRFPEQAEASAGLMIEVVGEQVVFGADPATASGHGARYLVPARGPVVERATSAPAGRQPS